MLVLLILLSIATELLLKYFNSPIYSFGERILSRIPVFLVGMIFAEYVKEKRKISPLFMLIAIPVAITGYVLTGFYSDKLDIVAVRYIYGVMSVAFVALLGFVLDKIKNIKVSKPIFGILNFCGALSLEIYLIHTFIIRFFGHYGIFQNCITDGITLLYRY